MKKLRLFLLNNIKEIIISILVFLSYFIYDYLAVYILGYYFNINYFALEQGKRITLIAIINSIYMLIVLFIYKKSLKKDFVDYKKNYKNYISKYLIFYVYGVILMGLINYILQQKLHLGLGGNETSIRESIKSFPIYMTFSTVLFAPFIEEIIFRKTIKNIFNNKYLFIILSGFIFGSLHISDFTNTNEILLGIPYIVMGLDFAYIYYKTDNIFTTMSFHMFHNLLLLIIQLI